MCGCLSCDPHWGPSPQPRHVPQPGIKLVTHWLTDQCSIHWATPARDIFWSIFYCLCVTVVPFFSTLTPHRPAPPSLQHTPLPLVHVHDCTYKVFGFSISYTILNLPLSILCLPIMLLIPCTFSPILPLPLPTDNLLCDLHFCDSIPVLAVCLVFVF